MPARIDRMYLAIKLRDIAAKIEDILEFTRLEQHTEFDLYSAASSIRAAALDLDPPNHGTVTRCSKCGFLAGCTDKYCGACGTAKGG